jgi:hypothetical protein
MIGHDRIIAGLLASEEPSIRWKTRVLVLEEAPLSPSIRALEAEIHKSPRVLSILRYRDSETRLPAPGNVYSKWQGAHWVLATLADIGYPYGDIALRPLMNQVLDLWLSDLYYTEFHCDSKKKSYQQKGVPIIQGRHRRCAAQQGNALFVMMKLGLEDDRMGKLVERLLHWQWPDGGWNCDKEPDASHSSFMETLIPLRGLSAYAGKHKDLNVQKAIQLAAEVFLKRRLYKKTDTGALINEDFTRLHYPLYWHYDILGSLKVMAESGFISDDRCSDALDLLERKCLPDGGWAAEKRYYTTVSETFKAGADFVDWGGVDKRAVNEWVTVDALYVLQKAGRLKNQ